MTAVAAGDGFSLRLPLAMSVLLHVAAAAALVFVRGTPRAPSAPIYRVSLIAAPPGERAIGVVQPNPPAETPPASAATSPAPPPRARETPAPEKMTLPVKAPASRVLKTATPNASKTATPAAAKSASSSPAKKAPAPVAGGGPVGGRGADVANVKADGIAFPYPVYLANIVRQIALNFKPSARGALTAEVSFMIRRDGTVAGARLTRRSSVYSFDQDALAAIELASRAFGPLPDGFSDDVLPVVFSFDPHLIH
ncbi:MAG: TonB C-terminal domain-containing protein [Gemmatimonadota bacterium]|nr:TonB C-terminal domain-containing protein [Gemmatimonadota bacterium]